MLERSIATIIAGLLIAGVVTGSVIAEQTPAKMHSKAEVSQPSNSVALLQPYQNAPPPRAVSLTYTIGNLGDFQTGLVSVCLIAGNASSGNKPIVINTFIPFTPPSPDGTRTSLVPVPEQLGIKVAETGQAIVNLQCGEALSSTKLGSSALAPISVTLVSAQLKY